MTAEIECAYLIRTGDDARELTLLFILTFDNGFNDTWMIGSQVHEAMGYAGLLGS